MGSNIYKFFSERVFQKPWKLVETSGKRWVLVVFPYAQNFKTYIYGKVYKSFLERVHQKLWKLVETIKKTINLGDFLVYSKFGLWARLSNNINIR